MTIEIKVTGETAEDVLNSIRSMFYSTVPTAFPAAPPVDNAHVAEGAAKFAEPEKKTRKAKEEKVAEPKAEVLAPEKPKYTLQDAIDRAREIAGDGKDEKIMNALKGINTRLGISKVREIPPEKLDGYMKELNAEFPKDAAGETTANMFD